MFYLCQLLPAHCVHCAYTDIFVKIIATKLKNLIMFVLISFGPINKYKYSEENYTTNLFLFKILSKVKFYFTNVCTVIN